MKLILGSSSKFRKGILTNAGYVFDVLIPDVDEKSIETSNPYERPLILARAKADALMERVKEPALIITSDVVAICGGKLAEKPESETEARQFLQKYQNGVAPETICALVVVNTETKEKYEGVDNAKTFFKPFPDSMIEDFIKNGEPLARAGGFGAMHPIMKPWIMKIEGREESVAGMPLDLLKKLLAQAGYFGI